VGAAHHPIVIARYEAISGHGGGIPLVAQASLPVSITCFLLATQYSRLTNVILSPTPSTLNGKEANVSSTAHHPIVIVLRSALETDNLRLSEIS
jgi:hypothetical protein